MTKAKPLPKKPDPAVETTKVPFGGKKASPFVKGGGKGGKK